MKKYVFFCVTCLFIVSSCISENSSPAPKPDVEAITISNKISEIIVGRQHQFEATFSPIEAETPENYTWRSSDASIATINSAGLFTAIDEGEVTITLTSVVSRKKGTIELSDEMTITVLSVEIEQILLDQESLEMVNGSNATLTVSFLPADAKPREIEWSSSNNLIAMVADGVITARSVGNAIIAAKVKGADIEATCSIRVNPVVLSSIRFDTENPLQWDTLEIGHTRTTRLIFIPDSAEDKRVFYTSLQPMIATVNANGVIKGESKGRATIRATSLLAESVMADYRVEVVTVPDLVIVTVEKEDFRTIDAISSGIINATLTNNSSKPVEILRFRVRDRYNNPHSGRLINETLEPFTSFEVKAVQFANAQLPEAVFTIIYDGVEYDRNIRIE